MILVVKYKKSLNIIFIPHEGISFLNLRFENDVKMYGIQTCWCNYDRNNKFGNDVKMAFRLFGFRMCGDIPGELPW